MATITPYSPLNMYQTQPVAAVSSGGEDTSALDKLFADANGFRKEQETARLAASTYTMALANNSAGILQLFSDSSSDEALQNSMNNMLQATYMPGTQPSASSTTPKDETNLQLLRSLFA